jgi:hypothetical protein
MALESGHKTVHGTDEQLHLPQNLAAKIMGVDNHVEKPVICGHVDGTLQLGSEENARLVRKLHWR